MESTDFFSHVPDLSAAARAEAWKVQSQLTKPPGSLGRLEEIGAWMASVQDAVPPHPIDKARVVVFAGDHGIATRGVSNFDPIVSIQTFDNIATGGAGVCALAATQGAEIRLVDISLDRDSDDPYHVRRCSGSIDMEDAMSEDELAASLNAGIAIANEEIDAGADILIPGDLGIGNTTIAAALIGAYTRTEPVKVTGRGSGIDDATWKPKVAAVRDAMFRARSFGRDPFKVLKAIGSPDLAAMAAFMAQAASRRTPVILDGAIVTAAALWANRLAPGASNFWIAGHRSPEPAHTYALRELELTPILDLGMRLGEGSGAVEALPHIRSAVMIFHHMATFEGAGVNAALFS